ncbi:hypothetical protein ElyMa_004738500 [Elysia marginata]|uniref:Uncharacterized protein n=1 Tax=Elysia marginata TaxID=1093978 RepID=A0AAV4IB16_9GAST|nr:hypothetical protein ElyMa_004738500 [Elysia marginata]
MDPISRTIWKSSLGPEFFEGDSSSSGSGGGANYGMEAISNYIVQSMFKPQPYDPRPAFSHSQPTFTSSNVVTPSAVDPSKDTSNLVNPYNSAPFAASPPTSANSVVSPAAPMPTGLTPTSASSPPNTDSGPDQISFSSGTSASVPFSPMRTTRRNDFFQTFMMMRMLEMMEFF